MTLILTALPVSLLAQQVGWMDSRGPQTRRSTSVITQDQEGRLLVSGFSVLNRYDPDTRTWEVLRGVRGYIVSLYCGADFSLAGVSRPVVTGDQNGGTDASSGDNIQSIPPRYSTFVISRDGWQSAEGIGLDFGYAPPDNIVEWNGSLFGAGDFGAAISHVDHPKQWTLIDSSDSDDFRVSSFLADSTSLLAATVDGLFEFNPADSTWSQLALDNVPVSEAIRLSDSLLVLGTDRGVYTWSAARDTTLLGLRDQNVGYMSLEPDGDLLLGNHNGVFRVTEVAGSSYEALQSKSVQQFTSMMNKYITDLYAGPQGSYAGTTRSLYKYDEAQNQWYPVERPGSDVRRIRFEGQEVLVGTFSNGAYRYDRAEDRWNDLGFYDETVNDMLKLGDGRYLVATYRGLHHTSDDGESWELIDQRIYWGLSQTARGTILAGVQGKLLEYSADLEDKTELLAIHEDAFFRRIIEFEGGRIMASTGVGVYASSDTGKTWQQKFEHLDLFHRIPGTEGVAGLQGYQKDTLRYSMDYGQTWQLIELPDSLDGAAFVDHNSIVAYQNVGRPDGHRLFLSNDLGGHWRQLSDDLPRAGIDQMEVDSSGTVWINPFRDKVYHTEELKILDVPDDDPSAVRPDRVYLYQNYPNPFNPATAISFELPSSGFVELVVFNLMGRKVATLVDGNKPAGTHTVHFDGSGLSSGVYFYRLSTQNYTAVKKMTLVK